MGSHLRYATYVLQSMHTTVSRRSVRERNIMKRAVIVHGFKGKPDTNWKPWLKTQLEMNGFSVEVPEMPNTNHPLVNEWVDTLSATVGQIDTDELYLIGHSLGCITILKYLEALQEGQKVKACIFVAGFGRKFNKYQGGHDSFFEQEIDWYKAAQHSDTFIALHSIDDQNVDSEELALFGDKLKAKTTLVNERGHFGSQDGVFEVPDVLDTILSI